MKYLKGFLENIRLFFVGAFDFKSKSVAVLEHQYDQEMEEFFILCFSDLIGIDLPTSYYALELYPYFAEELAKFQSNSNDRKSVWESMAENLDFDP